MNGESNSIGLNADIVNCTMIIAIVAKPAVKDDVRELKTLVTTPTYMNNKTKGIMANNKVVIGNNSKNNPIYTHPTNVARRKGRISPINRAVSLEIVYSLRLIGRVSEKQIDPFSISLANTFIVPREIIRIPKKN